MEEINAELALIAKDNYNQMMNSNMERLSKEEVNTLRKLGLSHDEIANVGPGENPFKNGGLAKNKDIMDLIKQQ